MKRLLACSDIHGQHKQLAELLEKCGYDPEKDQLVLCGDYVDRGPDSRKVIELVIELVKNGAIALRGNHDDMMMYNAEYGEVWEKNGGSNTIASYSGYTELFHEHIKWMHENLRLYYETDQFIFVHAGVMPNIPLKDQRETDLIWSRFRGRCNMGKLIVHGHTVVPDIQQVYDQLFIDTGSVFDGLELEDGSTFHGKLTMIELPSGELWEA